MAETRRLSRPQVYWVVNTYIGGEGGYLEDFSYPKHREFYAQFCDLDIRTEDYDGTTRQRFLAILESADGTVQAKILRELLTKCPPTKGNRLEGGSKMIEMIDWLEEGRSVAAIDPKITSDVVQRSLSDAEALLNRGEPTSAVDRVHTALHGYLMAICDDARLTYAADASAPTLFGLLRDSHPSLRPTDPRPQEITRLLRALAGIVDTLGPLRNMASVAHPNRALLERAEAMLVVNAARTLLNYLDEKLGGRAPASGAKTPG